MPRSAVIYTSPDAFAGLKEEARRKFAHLPLKPYTFSYGQRTDAGSVRVRVTEVLDGALAQEWVRLVERGEATPASSADRDVRRRTFEELMADADRARREACLQLVSPTIVEVNAQALPFPVFPVIFEQYIAAWNTFSDALIGPWKDGLDHVRVTDFRISCVASPFGPGSQGWVKLEMEKGRTEGEIGLFNALLDFAFYCGTGLHTEEGLGQTRRMERGAK
jgi:hypothetical protein